MVAQYNFQCQIVERRICHAAAADAFKSFMDDVLCTGRGARHGKVRRACAYVRQAPHFGFDGLRFGSHARLAELRTRTVRNRVAWAFYLARALIVRSLHLSLSLAHSLARLCYSHASCSLVQSSARTLLISSNQLTLKFCCCCCFCSRYLFLLRNTYKQTHIHTFIHTYVHTSVSHGSVTVFVFLFVSWNLRALCVLIYLRLVWFQGEIRKNKRNIRIDELI